LFKAVKEVGVNGSNCAFLRLLYVQKSPRKVG